jgi:co-chaperonin GroES (HSP10)
MDAERIQAQGPWVLVKPEPVAAKSKGGLYLPEGNLLERLGHVVARVVSAGKGYYERSEKTGKERFIAQEVQVGDRVVFRGHLKDANKVLMNETHCFMHARDLIGILEKDADLDLALPYDN